MALNLSVAQPSGITVSYWKVTKLHIDIINSNINVEIAGYLDYSTYLSGGQNVTVMVESIGPDQYSSILSSSNLMNELYTVLSTMPDFTGSTIVA